MPFPFGAFIARQAKSTKPPNDKKMNVIAEIQRINERELELGVPFEGSWHQKYRESAWVYVGGLPFELTEGDVLCVMSQFGEIEDVNLVRDVTTGKSKGFCFLKYENQRSTVLAVDNMNGARVLERVIRVDHVLQYKLPKEIRDREDAKDNAALSSDDDSDDDSKRPRGLPGHAYEGKELDGKYDISHGHNVFAAPEESKKERKKRRKEEKKLKKQVKKEKKLEEKQVALFAEIQKKRKLQREQEMRELERKQRQGDADEVGVAGEQPSSTGWRGRLEPNAPQPQGKRSHGEAGGGGRRDFKDSGDASYGGSKRTR